MSQRGALKVVVEGFLGTFVSRYSDYRGWWLLGFLVADLDQRTIDLLGPVTAGSSQSPWTAAEQRARAAFLDQAAKLRLPLETLRTAVVGFERSQTPTTDDVNGEGWEGFAVTISVRAEALDGRTVERRRQLFVAPHCERRERRRRGWG